MRLKYFILRASPVGNIPNFLHYQIEKNELFLSSNVKLSGITKMAFIESQSLAEQFKEACMPRLQKRYGADFDMEIEACESLNVEFTQNKISEDSNKIKRRLVTGNFAPNKLA